MQAHLILQPVIVVGLLTVVVTILMFFTRIPAMQRLKINPQKGADTSELKKLLPDEVNRVSNNYNHLFEQPTLFYAVAITIALLGHVDSIHIYCAWIFAVLRIAHSLVQVTVDHVMTRFLLFVTSWLVLAVMLVREAIAIFSM